MTMIKRWNKPKSFSGGDILQPPDDPVDLTSKFTTQDEDVRLMCPVCFHLWQCIHWTDWWEHACASFPDGSESGAGAEAEEWNESGSSTETETHGTELFWLDYQADSGTITSFLVHKVNRHPSVWSFWLFVSFGLLKFCLVFTPLCSFCL